MDIKARLRERGIKQVHLAERFGVTEAAVSKWVNGVNSIPHHHLRGMAAALAVPVEELLPAPSNDEAGSRTQNG